MTRSLLSQLLALALLAMVTASGLQIEVLEKPEDCKLKSRNGDQLSMQ